ncbi:putative Glycosyltransferase involved in cell wall biosynthesis [Vibrio chagasii]|nr:putative Glycosyltransferase involved in cell wall biosynthesis [Vibrio chagasii]CAH7328538.1 putative Glycosyltransferase involved in cell wall biosynthesis [Vibrio chagasii]
MSKKILFITSENLSNKTASVIRFNSIKDGFEKNAYRVEYKSYFYSNKLMSIGSYLMTLLLLLRCKSDIFIYGPTCIPNFIQKIAKKNGCKIYAERTEFPFHLISNNLSLIKIFFSRLYLKKIQNVDQFFTCSHALVEFYSKYAQSSKFSIIPLFISKEISEREVIFKRSFDITYCGYMGNNKDGVDNLIDAFSLYIESNNDYRYKLQLIGSAESKEMSRLQDKVLEKKLKDNVVFLGRLPHQEVISRLFFSDALILARPNNQQAQGGFPSKLGEYLSTGKPVICTDVGDIREVFGDELVKYCHSDSIIDISKAIKDVFDDYELHMSFYNKRKLSAYKYSPENLIRCHLR